MFVQIRLNLVGQLILAVGMRDDKRACPGILQVRNEGQECAVVFPGDQAGEDKLMLSDKILGRVFTDRYAVNSGRVDQCRSGQNAVFRDDLRDGGVQNISDCQHRSSPLPFE